MSTTLELLPVETPAPSFFRAPDLPVCSVHLNNGEWIMWDWNGTGWHHMSTEQRLAIKADEKSAFEQDRRG